MTALGFSGWSVTGEVASGPRVQLSPGSAFREKDNHALSSEVFLLRKESFRGVLRSVKIQCLFALF